MLSKTYMTIHYIIRRYVKYLQCLLSSNNETIWNLANLAINTTRSVTGLNVTNIREEFGLDPVSVDRREFFVEKREIPDNATAWRILNC